ncbi:MAG TPA: hypothetical protein VGQ53_10000 [Chitinophagaceae bacterium]|jgi:hypothetical protein|nr:hypothetical protein [Chitinophagaceae bacterium]
MKSLSINRALVTALIFFLFAFLFSCQKENSSATSHDGVTEQDAATYSDESAQADESFDDIADVSMTAADADNTATNGRLNRDYLPDFAELRAAIGLCATITVTPNDSTYPKTITIDFSDSCVGLDGKLRSGKIIINLTAPLRKPGSVLTVTLDNFYMNHIHIEGTKTITNLSENGAVKFSVQVTGGKVTFPSGRGYSYESSKTKVQVAGMDTKICRDDVFEITGSATIKFNNGVVVKFEVVDPLIKKVVCPWLSDGTLKISINDRVLKIDYGFPHNGDCDNKALLTWNDGNSERVILLP